MKLTVKDTDKVASEYCSENCEDGCNCSETGVCTCDESVCGNEAGKCGAGLWIQQRAIVEKQD